MTTNIPDTRELIIYLVKFMAVLVFYAPSLANAQPDTPTNQPSDKTEIILWADDGYPPYSYVKGDEVAGFYPALINQITKEMPEFQVTLRPIPWKRGLQKIEQGTGFGLLPPYKFENERPYMNPYSHPLYTESVVIFCRADKLKDNFNGVWPTDYFGMTISTNLGYQLFKNEMWQPFKSGDIHHAEFQGTEENLLQLAVTGKVDCYANDRNSTAQSLKQLEQALQQQKRQHLLQPIVETSVLLRQQGYIGYSQKYRDKFPESEQFIARFDEQLRRFIESGEYDKFVAHYWDKLVHNEAD